jgi:hypothetical protein
MAKAKLTFYPGKIKNLDKRVVENLELTAEELHTRIINSEKMPFDTGMMQNEQTFIDNSKSSQGLVSLVVDAPQARRLYFHPEYDFQTIKNSKAGGAWFADFLPGGSRSNEIAQIYSNLAKRRGVI